MEEPAKSIGKNTKQCSRWKSLFRSLMGRGIVVPRVWFQGTIIAPHGAHNRQQTHKMRKCISADQFLKQNKKTTDETKLVSLYYYYSNELRRVCLLENTDDNLCACDKKWCVCVCVWLGADAKKENKCQSIFTRRQMEMQGETKRSTDVKIIHTGYIKWIINDAMMTLTKYFYCHWMWNAFVTPSGNISPRQLAIKSETSTGVHRAKETENISIIIAKWKHHQKKMYLLDGWRHA